MLISRIFPLVAVCIFFVQCRTGKTSVNETKPFQESDIYSETAHFKAVYKEAAMKYDFKSSTLNDFKKWQ